MVVCYALQFENVPVFCGNDFKWSSVAFYFIPCECIAEYCIDLAEVYHSFSMDKGWKEFSALTLVGAEKSEKKMLPRLCRESFV